LNLDALGAAFASEDAGDTGANLLHRSVSLKSPGSDESRRGRNPSRTTESETKGNPSYSTQSNTEGNPSRTTQSYAQGKPNGFWLDSSDCQRAGTPRQAGRTADNS